MASSVSVSQCCCLLLIADREMYYRTLILCCMLMLAIYETECGEKYLQNLQPQPGYIPVYIRPGDTPLEDINMDLAEAFRSYAYRHYKINSARAKAKNILDTKEKSNFIEEEKNIPVITLYDDDYNREQLKNEKLRVQNIQQKNS